MKKIISLLLVLTLMCAALSACASGESEQPVTESEQPVTSADPEAGEAESGEETVIGVSMNSMDEFRTDWLGFFEQFANEAGCKLIVTNADNDANKQIADLESLIVQEPDIVVVTPVSAGACDPGIEALYEAGIPCMAIDFEPATENYVTKYGPDMATSISMCAEYCANEAKEKGVTLQWAEMVGSYAMGDVESTRVELTEEAVKAVQPDSVCLAVQEGNFAADQAMGITEDWLQAYPQINAIFCHNDDMAIGVIQALNAAGVDMDNFWVTGTDATAAAMEYIESGELDATAGRDIEGEAKDALDLCFKILAGETVEHQIVGCGLSLITAS